MSESMSVAEIQSVIASMRLTAKEKAQIRRAIREARPRSTPQNKRRGGRPRSRHCGTCGLPKSGENAYLVRRTYVNLDGSIVTNTYIECMNCRRGLTSCRCGHTKRQHLKSMNGECCHTDEDRRFDCECVRFAVR